MCARMCICMEYVCSGHLFEISMDNTVGKNKVVL